MYIVSIPAESNSVLVSLFIVLIVCSNQYLINLLRQKRCMIRKLKSGQYRIYSRKVDPKTKKRRNLGTFDSKEAAQKHEKEIQYFKHH